MLQLGSIGNTLLGVHRRDSIMMHLSSRMVSRVCFAKPAQGRKWLCQSSNTSLALCHKARGLHFPARRERSGLSCRGVSERRQQAAEQGTGPISEDEFPAEIDRWSPKALLEPLTPHMLMVSVQLSFSVWYVLGRLVLSGGSDPLTFALLRETVSSCLLLYLGRNREGDVQLQSSEDAGRFLLLGFLSFVNISGFTAALALVSEFNCAIVQPIVPVVALGLSALLGKEKFSASSGVGLAFSVTGAILVTALGAAGSTGEGVDSSSFIIGNLCLLAQVFGLAGLMVCMSDVSSRYPPLTTTAWYYTISSVMCGWAVFQTQGWQIAPLLQELQSYNNVAIWGTLLYVIVFATVFNYSAMTSVSKQLPPSNISAYTTLQPFLVAGLSYVAFGTEVSDAEIAASSLIVLGLFISILPPDLFAKLLGKGDSEVAASMKQHESLPARAAAVLESLADGAYDLTCNFLPSEMQLRRWNKAAMRRLQLAFLSEEEAIKARQRAEEGEVPEWVQEMLLHLDDKRPIGRSPRRY